MHTHTRHAHKNMYGEARLSARAQEARCRDAAACAAASAVWPGPGPAAAACAAARRSHLEEGPLGVHVLQQLLLPAGHGLLERLANAEPHGQVDARLRREAGGGDAGSRSHGARAEVSQRGGGGARAPRRTIATGGEGRGGEAGCWRPRTWVQAKIQGMARSVSMPPLLARAEGRLPMLSRPSSLRMWQQQGQQQQSQQGRHTSTTLGALPRKPLLAPATLASARRKGPSRHRRRIVAGTPFGNARAREEGGRWEERT